jgi:hypothetical protein
MAYFWLCPAYRARLPFVVRVGTSSCFTRESPKIGEISDKMTKIPFANSKTYLTKCVLELDEVPIRGASSRLPRKDEYELC